MKKMKRIFLIVLDSLGAGEAPDADKFNDTGASTFKSLSLSPKLNIENLKDMGMGNIDGLSFLGSTAYPKAAHARMTEASQGKDTTIGHWEIAGHVSREPMPTFPDGFPNEIIEKISNAVSRKIICNRAYSGTEVIRDFGEKHVKTGALIVYTSADSVFQIAAHEDIVPIDELYSVCEKARELLTEKYGVGRVIARPFAGTFPDFHRTSSRRDFSLKPPKNLLPEAFVNFGLDSIGIGKIGDIFAGVGFTKSIPTHSNEEGMLLTEKMLGENFNGLCFVNLVDFDMKYGHRRDTDGYAEALSDFDRFLPRFCKKMTDSDILFITADHGCDPSFSKSTDHTREYTPLLIYSKKLIPENFGTRNTFADIAATIADLSGIDFKCDGSSLPLKFK